MNDNLPRVLCVDDEPQILLGLERTLFEHFDVSTAASGAEGLDLLCDEPDEFAVIVSDMRMPEMNGAAFLAAAKEREPRAVRILLTGHSEMSAAIDAVNRGSIFRFLCKPCPADELISTLDDAVEQHRLLALEHDLLSNTVTGAVRSMVQVLDLLAPTMGRRSNVLASYARHACQQLRIEDAWSIETAALLSQVGRVTLPSQLIDRVCAGAELEAVELEMLRESYVTAARLVEEIPRLERVGVLLRGMGGDLPRGTDAATVEAVNVLRTIDAFESDLSAGVDRARAGHRKACNTVDVLRAIRDHRPREEGGTRLRALNLVDLRPGMVLDDDVVASGGARVAPSGQALTLPLIERLRNFDRSMGIKQPLRVRI